MRLIIILLLIVSSPAFGTNYYVRTDGNDANNGLADTAGGAWLTMDFALGSSGVPTSGGPHTLNVRTGTYTSATFLNLNRSYGAILTVQPTTGLNDVTIKGNPSSIYNILQQGAIANLTFTNLTITDNPGSTYLVAFFTSSGKTASSILFTNCNLLATNGARSCIEWINGSASPVQSVMFGGCNLAMTLSNTATAPIYIGNNITNSDLILINSTVYSAALGGYVAGASAHFTNDTFLACAGTSTAVGFKFGFDGVSGVPVTGVAQACTFKSQTSHGLLIAAGCTNFFVINCAVQGGDYGMVMKNCTNCLVYGTTVLGGTLPNYPAFIFKGALRCVVTNCTIVSSGLTQAVANSDGDPTYQARSNSFMFNTVVTTQSAKLFEWDSAEDGGGNVIDYNRYYVGGSGQYGTVLGSATPTLNVLIQRWQSYSVPTNDQHSRDITIPVEFAAPF